MRSTRYGGGFANTDSEDVSDGEVANERFRATKGREQKLVDMIADVLDRRSVQTHVISRGLERLDIHAQQHLMDIIMELLGHWKINYDSGLYRKGGQWPNHILGPVYESAARMLSALDYVPPEEPVGRRSGGIGRHREVSED